MSDEAKMTIVDRTWLVNSADMLEELYESRLTDPNSLIKFSDKKRYISYVR